MGASTVSLRRELAQGVDIPQVLAAIDIHDHRRVERRWIGIIPEKELLTVALEGDFDQVRHCLLRPRAQSQELLPAPAHELFRSHLAELLQMLSDCLAQ